MVQGFRENGIYPDALYEYEAVHLITVVVLIVIVALSIVAWHVEGYFGF